MRFKYFLLVLIFSSCQHFIKEEEKGSHEDSSSKKFYQGLYKATPAPVKNAYGEVPLDEHPDVDKWIRYFTGRGRDYMRVYLERSSRYVPVMKKILKENGLPPELVYVALIESGFSPRALSRAQAVGYWQFIYGTGKRYGLRIDGFVDERRDPLLSTQAAASYFKDLYSLFGSWHLALAAYNSGEYRVNRAVLKHYNRDFWYLSSKKALPAETRNYIPKLIAAIHIAKNPQKYGFSDLKFQALLSYESVELKQSISLKKLANNIATDLEQIQSLNPMYKGEYVPIYESSTKIRVPQGLLSSAQLSLNKSVMAAPNYIYHYHYTYRVKKGDTLYRIARNNKTSVSKIRRSNNLGRSSLIRVGQKIKIPSKRLVAKKVSSKRNLATASKNKSSNKNKEYHKVARGQSLFSIAKLHGLGLKNLKALNNIQGNPTIHPGQKLRVKKITLAKSAYHVVSKGETLIGIAKRYKISLPKLMQENTLSFKSILLTGRRLSIPSK